MAMAIALASALGIVIMSCKTDVFFKFASIFCLVFDMTLIAFQLNAHRQSTIFLQPVKIHSINLFNLPEVKVDGKTEEQKSAQIFLENDTFHLSK